MVPYERVIHSFITSFIHDSIDVSAAHIVDASFFGIAVFFYKVDLSFVSSCIVVVAPLLLVVVEFLHVIILKIAPFRRVTLFVAMVAWIVVVTIL